METLTGKNITEAAPNPNMETLKAKKDVKAKKTTKATQEKKEMKATTATEATKEKRATKTTQAKKEMKTTTATEDEKEKEATKTKQAKEVLRQVLRPSRAMQCLLDTDALTTTTDPREKGNEESKALKTNYAVIVLLV